MSISGDPRYQGLARRAASGLGTSSPNIVRAILAQWQCEVAPSWPPTRNNPGNLAAGAATGIRVRFTIPDASSNPQPGNPIVTFPSPSAGADAYAKLIRSLPRYAPALAAARAGDGQAFVTAIGHSGWGTGLSCMLGVLGSKPVGGVGGHAPPPGLPVGIPVSAPGTGNVAASLAALQAQLRALGIDASPTHVITDAEAMLIATKIYGVSGDVAAAIAHNWAGKTVQNRAEAAATGKPETTTPFPTLDGAIAALFGDFKWVPVLAANMAVVAGIGVLAYIGLKNLSDGLGSSG